MYAIKRELKLDNKQKNFVAGCAGFSRFVYNHGLSLLKSTWDIPEISGSDSKRLDAIKKVFTNITKKQREYLWTNKYSSRIYQNAFRDLKKAFSRWRDPKIKTFATLSDGNTLEAPSSIKRAKTKLGKIQWRNRNKVLGNRRSEIDPSKNAVKYYQKLRKKHKRITNIREDFLQKTTTLLAKTYQHILIEDLNIKGMMANHKLSDALSSLGLYRFRELLSYKQECFGFLLTIAAILILKNGNVLIHYFCLFVGIVPLIS